MEHCPLCLAKSFSQTGSIQPTGMDVCSVDMLRYGIDIGMYVRGLLL